MLPAKQFKQLHDLIDLIYEAAYDKGLSWPQLAAAAGLANSTVYNLGNPKTMFPRTQTVLLLAKAAGCELRFVKVAGRPKLKLRSA